MRRNPTEAERALWRVLRARRLCGWKFRRQVRIDPYIVDFVCFSARVIVEADGSQHAESESDAVRDAFLKAQGFRVLRFWNNDVLTNREGVLTALLAALETPLPNPSPARGEGLQTATHRFSSPLAGEDSEAWRGGRPAHHSCDSDRRMTLTAIPSSAAPRCPPARAFTFLHILVCAKGSACSVATPPRETLARTS
ncbi:MAG: endonuclease domain-containing protein [Novosphingobium sp.]|nr:endonuclease domain-containing protein [Novosphingobium sp.]